MAANRFKNKLQGDTKVLTLNIINSFIVKGGSLFIALFTTPAYMRYFNDDALLGIWYTMLSILTWILYFDMGIGNGVRNKLVECLGENNKELARKYISSAYIFLAFISVFIGIIILVGFNYLNWNSILNVSEVSISKKILLQAVKIVVISILLQFILRIITSILYAVQKAFVPNFLSLCTNIILLIWVLGANARGFNNDIISLSIVYLLAVNVPLIIATLYVFMRPLKELSPDIKYFDKECAFDTFKTGGSFLTLQLMGMLVGSSLVVYLITALVGPKSVVEYNIYYKVYNQVYMIFFIMLTPIWSAATKAKSENNFSWLKKMVRNLRGLALLMFVGQFFLLAIMQWFFDFWLGDQSIRADIGTQLVFIVNSGVMMIYALTAQVCNGLNELKTQFKWMITAAILIFPLSILGTKIHMHYTSVLIAQTLALLPYCVFQSIWLNKYFVKYASKKLITREASTLAKSELPATE